MSHFTVLVMGKNVCDLAVLDEVMLPFHEFECTGINKHIQEIDETAEARSTYESETRDFYVYPDGTKRDVYSKENTDFYRPATEAEIDLIEDGKFEGTHKRRYDKGNPIYTVLELPEGVTRQSFATKDVTSFEDWLQGYYNYQIVVNEPTGVAEIDTDGSHKYGYILKNGDEYTVIRRTNPNAEWDWYVPGGRWSGELILKEGASGLRGRGWSCDHSNGNFDGATKSDINFDAMKAANMTTRREAWNRTVKKMMDAAGEDFFATSTPDEHRVRLVKRFDELKALWEKDRQEQLWTFIEKNVNAIDYKFLSIFFDYFDGLGNSHCSFDNIEDWINATPAFFSYALLIDGNWIAKGEMGWFGMSNDEHKPEEWEAIVSKAIADLPDDHQMVVVDCHI